MFVFVDTVCEEQCKDIDECQVGMRTCDANGENCVTSPACHPDADCINTPGGFKCDCKDGYTGSGKICEGKHFFFRNL